MKTNPSKTCPKCSARVDRVGHDCVVYECYSAAYILNGDALTVSTQCLQRQINQLTEKLDNVLSMLSDK